MIDTSIKGSVTEVMCLGEFIKLGFSVSIPYGNNERYDFIIDDGDKLYRVQCKTAHYKDNSKSSFEITIHNTRTNTKKTTIKYYDKSQIDLFATYINNNLYVIPVEECGKASKTLRINNFIINSHNNADKYLAKNYFGRDNYFEIENNIKYYNKTPKFERFKKEKQNYCPICGVLISKHSKLCPTCHSNSTRKIKRPSRDELKNLIRNTPFTQIAQQFGVTDNAIRLWCRTYNLPDKVKNILQIDDFNWEQT